MSTISISIAENVRQVTDQLNAATQAAGRAADSVELIAVSKRHSAGMVKQAHAQGLQHFGENYWQEALEKIDALQDLPLIWHFIGPIQSNKTRGIAQRCDWVHTVDRLKIAERLSAQRETDAPLNVCLQVNVDGDDNKSGVAPEALPELLAAVAELPRLALRGLMTITHQDTNPAVGFARLAQLHADHAHLAPSANWDSLSMGMSADFPAAIAAGATHVRVGSAIFGPRG